MDDQSVETTIYSLRAKAPDRPRRRGDDRYLSLFRVGALIVDDRQELCLIRNISAGGMMIRAYSAIAPGTRVSVELKQGEPVAGTASWSEDGSVGVSFDQPIDVLSLIAPADDGPRPRMPRVEVDTTAHVRDGADVHDVQTINISQGGLCVESASELTVYADVVVTLDGLPPIPGVVKWRAGKSYGISFNRLLALSELMAWLQEQQKTAAVA